MASRKVQQIILKKKIKSMDKLPTLSTSVMQILRLLNDENCSRPKLLNAINRDPSICAEMLKMINSGLYGMKQTIKNVDQAVTLLGLKAVRNLVLSASVMTIVSGKEKDVWLHSYSAALLMQDLVKTNELQVSDDIEVTMLVHDIGRVVLMEFSKANYRAVAQVANDEILPIHKAEERVMSVSHDVVADWLLEMWEIGPSIRIPVSIHHTDKIPKEYVLETALLELVDYVDLRARSIPAEAPHRDLLGEAGIDREIIPQLISYQEGIVSQLDQSSHLGGAMGGRQAQSSDELRFF